MLLHVPVINLYRIFKEKKNTSFIHLLMHCISSLVLSWWPNVYLFMKITFVVSTLFRLYSSILSHFSKSTDGKALAKFIREEIKRAECELLEVEEYSYMFTVSYFVKFF